MAKIIPSIEKINNFSVKPEEGELYLLNFLEKTLDDTFEVFFNPYMNGDRPDIVILRKNQGVYIIEVKDYHLKNYELDERKNWQVKNRTHDYNIKSPISQVLKYKDNLFELHIETLLELKIKDIRNFNIVSCGVYFHNATNDEIHSFLIEPFEEDTRYMDFLKYNIDLLGRNSLNEKSIEKIFRKRYLISNRPSFLFTENLYNSFKRFLKPPIHLKEQGKTINYSVAQQNIIYSTKNQQRIKGVVGSGKTTVLAARAVQIYKRTKGKILILTYNVTLKNFIKDKISIVREEFPWEAFTILNYHFFITAELNNIGVPVTVPSGFDEYSEEEKESYFETTYYSNKALFEKNKDKIIPFDAVLIDEIQDYKRVWMEIIKEYFLKPDGEYILFGDVKQNIYSNKIDKKDIVTNVIGKPIELKRCYRSDFKIKDLAIEYQKEIFKDKYEIDNFNTKAQTLEIQFERNQQGDIKYIYLPEADSIRTLYFIIHENAINKGIPPNDITILGESINLLREFDVFYRYSSNERTNTMFETNEMIYRMGFNFLKKNNLPDWIKSASNLLKLNIDKNQTKTFNQLSILFTIFELNKKHKGLFDAKLDYYCEKFKTTKSDFQSFIEKQQDFYDNFKNDFSPERLSKNLKIIRNNKKIHFYMNSGTIKISTIHSFKGWESELLFLILEPQFSNISFGQSFDELIYTGITRSRSNLILLNFGNKDYHEKIKNIVERIK